jgi:RNA polymerase sigma-70 factor, ECF subfamily
MSEPRAVPTPESQGSRAGALDWGTALVEHERWLRRVVAARVSEPQAVDEVMQEVALSAVGKRSPLKNPASIAVWLYRLAIRQVLLYRRRTGRQRGLVVRYAARHGGSGIDATASPLAWLVRDERQQIVQVALRRLPERDAQLLILKYTEGYAARELAERLGVAVATVEARLHRARHRLRVELAQIATEFEAHDHEQP